jgi:hypothetical protein
VSSGEVASKASEFDDVVAERRNLGRRALVRDQFVEKILIEFRKGFCRVAPGRARLSMVIRKILQLRMVRMAMRFTSRSAVLSLASSALHPDLRIL